MPIFVGTAGDDSIPGSTGDDTIQGNAGNDTLDGLAGNDSIEGGLGNDILIGGTGADTLNGGDGNDILVVDSSTDSVQEAANGGNDTVVASVNFALLANVEVETLTAGSATTAGVIDQTGTDPIALTGNNLAQTLQGNAGANVLDGGRNGNALTGDTLVGNAGNDTYIIRNVNDVIGGEGAAQGNDTVFVGAGDLEAGGQAVASFNLGTLSNGAQVETISAVEQRGTQNFVLTGNQFAQQVVGNFGANTLQGGGGADTLIGLDGNDTYILDAAGQTIQETTGTDSVTFAASFAPTTFTLGAGVSIETITMANNVVSVTGNEQAQTITGTAADNTLIGGGGADTLSGGGGNDTYVVDSGLATITDTAGALDTVYFSGTTGGYDLAAGVGVDVVVAGYDAAGLAASVATTTDTFVVGNELSQTLYGNAGANILDGDRGTGTNADTLRGGAGNDIYRVYSQTDTVDELAYTGTVAAPVAGADAGGTDLVFTSATYSLAAANVLGNVENLSVADQGGTTAGISLTGNTLANRITGNNAANTIDGGAGADVMIGLGGNDTYTVDNVGDRVIEASGGGTLDTINFATVAGFTAYTLEAGSEVDSINLGGNVVSVTGNAFAQTLLGTAAVETLNGGGGADLLNGQGGDDTYIVSDASAAILDATGNNVLIFNGTTGGYDVADGVSITSISATGTGNVFLVGNNLVQTITGNSGNNILNGQGGSNGALGDTLIGGAGDDVYRVFNTNLQGSTITLANGDVVTETANNGFDTVYTSVNYALGANIEQLAAADQANVTTLTLVGNAINNTIAGSNGNNVLVGGDGNDSLFGLGGADTFHFNSAVGIANSDIIADFNGGEGDRISLDAGVFAGLGPTIEATEFQTGTVATGTNATILFDQSTGRLFYDADGTGAGAAQLFATVSAGTNLTAANFVITPAGTLPTP